MFSPSFTVKCAIGRSSLTSKSLFTPLRASCPSKHCEFNTHTHAQGSIYSFVAPSGRSLPSCSTGIHQMSWSSLQQLSSLNFIYFSALWKKEKKNYRFHISLGLITSTVSRPRGASEIWDQVEGGEPDPTSHEKHSASRCYQALFYLWGPCAPVDDSNEENNIPSRGLN